MKCENCGKNEVTFLYQSNVNGHVTEKHLCADCAEKLGYTQKLTAHTQRIFDFFQPRLAPNVFTPSLLDFMNQRLPDPFDNLFDDFFADMPALGAPAESEPPQRPQDTLLEGEEQDQISKTRQLNALRMEMQKAVQEERFERAAELRDQIHSLEQQ